MARRKKLIQRKKPTRSKVPSANASAQIHQGVGPATDEADVSTNEVPEHDVDSESGRESQCIAAQTTRKPIPHRGKK